MAKEDILQQKITEYVLMPDEVEPCFSVWSDSVPTSSQVRVRYHYGRHGLESCTTNHAKIDAKKAFL